MVVEVVETNFSPGDDLGILRQLLHLDIVCFADQACFVRMNSKGREQLRRIFTLLLRQLDRAIVGARAGAAPDEQYFFHACFPCARQYRLAIGVEFAALEVGMAIYVHGLGL